MITIRDAKLAGHWLTPCRYVMLACVSRGSASRPTLLMDTRRLSTETRSRSYAKMILLVLPSFSLSRM